jgi:hypothetical protein
MSDTLKLFGFVKDVVYTPQIIKPLTEYDFENFSANRMKSSGLIKAGDSKIGYSKWISPKRSRSYPFQHIYNTLNSARMLTIIPIIKDEGKDGDIDKIQYSTVSWMNLMNVYIVLTYYESAQKSLKFSNKITKQEFNNELIKAQIGEIISYKQSALHWNRSLIENRFVTIFQQALDAYKSISYKTGVAIHQQESLQKYLTEVIGDFEQFKQLSLKGSAKASDRETRTNHLLEFLEDGVKAQLYIENYLGGVYHLTADEIIKEGNAYVIQESKNTKDGFLPSLSDIKDGLFKLILYANLDKLLLDEKEISFLCRLKLTGAKVRQKVRLPCPKTEFEKFTEANKDVLTKSRLELIYKLQLEAENNKRLQIEIASNVSKTVN